MRLLLLVLGSLLAGFALGWWLRYGLVEPTAMAQACDGGETSATCLLRDVTIQIFIHWGFGLAALLLALWQLWRPASWRLAAGLAVSVLGLILYNPLLAGTAVTLAGLSLARAPSLRPGAASVR